MESTMMPSKIQKKKLAKEQGRLFLQSWLDTKKETEVVAAQEAKQAKLDAAHARYIANMEAAHKRIEAKRAALAAAKIAAAEAWENMEDAKRYWLLGLYEDMHYDHSAGHSYAKKNVDEYGVWEYYLENANELWKKYGQ